MNKRERLRISNYIDENRDDIIQMYDKGASFGQIAKALGVARSTIYLRLVKWGVMIKKYVGPIRRKNEIPGKVRRKFSLDLLTKMKENTRINDKYMKFRGFKDEKETEKEQIVEVTKLPAI